MSYCGKAMKKAKEFLALLDVVESVFFVRKFRYAWVPGLWNEGKWLSEACLLRSLGLGPGTLGCGENGCV